MAIDFENHDVLNNYVAQFVQANLPEAKKKYNLKAKFQSEYNVHDIASKASVYNIETNPKVIEDGANAFFDIIRYTVANGGTIHTPLFNLRVRLPGEYVGDETRLNDGLFPEIRLNPTAAFRKYIRDTVKVEIAGIGDDIGHIGEAYDEASATTNDVATVGGLMTVRGHGLKVSGEAADNFGLFFICVSPFEAFKVDVLPVNEPRTLKFIVPAGLTTGRSYMIRVDTRSPVSGGGRLLKELRYLEAPFKIKGANP
jgi:hypothetical protein